MGLSVGPFTGDAVLFGLVAVGFVGGGRAVDVALEPPLVAFIALAVIGKPQPVSSFADEQWD
ncbi:hypothetical protein ACFV8Z_48285 [Streptomyces sp. NPDC059837]|uniref:hypothetical protein n=1 Tax=unclassified Streptomyces TaxID=2593676 RepID=UPI002258B4A2|nr:MULTISPECIES: hypothetical protein [unclassified Streptomyces]MCX4404629.1 hypothetical protein [Streptomyces sp. NBC_01764]MCX5190827.1 hypothetical protein [Streptomyces sp. NBC_00268]